MAAHQEVFSELERDPQLKKVYEHVCERMKGDPGHDVSHLLRVALWTMKLGEGKLQPRRAIAAALLHDLVNVPKNSPDRSRASELSANEARKLLAGLGFAAEEIEDIAIAVRQHSFSRGEIPERPLAKALQDADRLESLGAIGICRVFSTGTLMGTSYFDPQDPWAKGRKRDDKAFSVDHFFEKLFKIPELMTTAAGKAEAARRAEVLHEFLAQLGRELDHPYR